MEFSSEFKFESVNKLFEKSFKKNWDRPALSNYKGATLAYRDVAIRIAMLHVAFEVCGLRKGDKVAICALTYGAVAVPILHEFKAGNIHYLVNHCDAAVLFTDEAIWENLQESEMPHLAAAVQINNFKLLFSRTNKIRRTREHFNELFGRAYPNEFTPSDIHYYEDSADELALINYTSGTSGFSKGVMIPYRSLSSNIQFARLVEPQMNCESNVVSMLPSAHMYGLCISLPRSRAPRSSCRHSATSIPESSSRCP